MTANMLPGASMPPWTCARPTFSSWGGVFQAKSGWTLVVVDPRVPVDESRERITAVEEWVYWRSYRRLWLLAALGATFVCALLIWAASAAADISMRVPVTIGATLALAVVASPTIAAWSKLLTGPKWPSAIKLRVPIDADLWRLVRHLNSYRNVDLDCVDAVRGLLWAIAHTSPAHAELIHELAERFTGWSEHDASAIRRAAAQVWAQIPAAR